jgi:diguanylate cyclase (GGDEF)-like protein
MDKILYCVRKASRKKVSLPFPVIKTSKVSTAYQETFPLVIFDTSVFKKAMHLDLHRLSHKICFVHFTKADKYNASLVEKYGLFDYFTDSDSSSEIMFKVQRAQKILRLQNRLNQSKRDILEQKEELGRISFVDPTSGCFNWRYFMKRGAQELSRAHRHAYDVSFVATDIDNFRYINEMYGLEAGDFIIKELIAIIRDILRKEDILTRWREDEFFTILPYLSRSNVAKVAKRIKDSVSSTKFKYKKLSLSIGISIGVVSYPQDAVSNIQDVVNALEKCLIAAKRKGGNTIISYAPTGLKPAKGEKKEATIEELKGKLERLNALLTQDLLGVIYGFARAIEAKDLYTGKHVEETALIAERIAQEFKLPEQEIEDIKHAAVLHDLGKVGIDQRILSKKGPLSSKERELVKNHPLIAVEILRTINALRGAMPAILYHHENWDGSGYPLGLKDDEIPLGARIVAISDAYHALISDRPYRKAYTRKEALEIIKKESSTHFDPRVVKIFLKVVKQMEKKG